MLSTGLHNVQRRVDSKNTSSFIASSRHIVGVFMLNKIWASGTFQVWCHSDTVTCEQWYSWYPIAHLISGPAKGLQFSTLTRQSWTADSAPVIATYGVTLSVKRMAFLCRYIRRDIMWKHGVMNIQHAHGLIGPDRGARKVGRWVSVSPVAATDIPTRHLQLNLVQGCMWAVLRPRSVALAYAQVWCSGVVSGTTVRALVLGRFSQKKLK